MGLYLSILGINHGRTPEVISEKITEAGLLLWLWINN